MAKKKFINSARVEGYVYQHSLEIKKVKNEASENYGKEFIGGKVSIATDENCINVVDIHYSYVTPTTKSGSTNRTYTALTQIINGPTVLNDGKDNALKVQIDTSIALNDFYNTENNEKKLVSAKRLEGGFVTIVNAIEPNEVKRNTFTTDVVIAGLKKVEPEAEDQEEYLELKSYIFDFRGAVLPTTFKIKNPEGIAFFENLNPTGSAPIFTKIWGNIISQTIVTEITEPTAFGVPSVRQVTKSNKEYLITGTAQDIGLFDDETTITAEELKKALQDREIYLAEVKKRQEEYESKKGGTSTAANPAPIADNNFNF